MAEIIFEHVTKMFQDAVALEDVSFQIDKGEFVFITGKSGAGKSTLLNLIIKQEEVTSGHIIVAGKRVETLKKNRVPYHRRRFGIMMQDIGMLEGMTVYENIYLSILATGHLDRNAKKYIMGVLGSVGIAGKANAYPRELSGGELARALLARALSVGPEILLADEPTANLDPDAAWDLMLLLQEINRKGMTVIVSTHARELVTIMKKRVLTLVAGALVADEKQAVYNQKAMDIFEERRVLEERAKKMEKKR